VTHYLIKRGSIFYFNRRIRGNILRISLSTDNHKLAKEIAASIYLVTTKGIRHRMSYERIKQEAQRIASELHEEWLEDRLDTQFCESDDRNMIANDEMVVSELTELIHQRKLRGDRLKDALADLAFVALKRKTLEEFSSPANILDSLLQLTSATPIQPTNPKVIQQILLTDKLEEFLNEKKLLSDDIQESTLEEYRLSVSELVEISNNKTAHEFTYDDAKTYRNTMLKLPKHRKQNSFKGKSISELSLLELPKEKKLSNKTINGRLTNLSTYFIWLKRASYVDLNPFEGLKLQNDSKSYAELSSSNLKDIFQSPLFSDAGYRKNKKTGKQSHWWLLVLAAYTGARLGELVQLRVKDITTENNRLTLNITDDDDDMRVKTTAGIRKFPVHDDLLTLGLKEYIDQLKASKQIQVLPQLPKGLKKAGDQTSKWYNGRYRDKYLPTFKSERKVFHSFRHTYIQQAIRADMAIPKLQQIVGHEPQIFGETATYAGSGFSQNQLKAELNKFSYEGFSIKDIAGGWEELLAPEPMPQ
jgi:integrase